MAPQQYYECPHGFHIDDCNICTDRRMHYLRRISNNSRGGRTWNSIHRNTLQDLANTIYPDAHLIYNQKIGRFRNGRTRVLITQNMRNAAGNFLNSYGRANANTRLRIAERFFNHSINAIHDQENNVNYNYHSGNNLPSPARSLHSNRSGSTRFTAVKKSPMSPGVTSRRKRR